MKHYQESEEMYLETILLLSEKSDKVRSIDIANELSYSRPSVSRAVNLLQNKGLIYIDPNGLITFTEDGLKLAKEIYERHHIITEVLVKLGADRLLAEENACRIEHVITKDLMDVLKKFIN